MDRIKQIEEKLELPQYQDQVFKEGTTITISTRLYDQLLKAHSNVAKLLNHLQMVNVTVNKQIIASSKAKEALQKQLESFAPELMEVYIDAVDQGLTETKKQKEDGDTIEPIEQQG